MGFKVLIKKEELLKTFEDIISDPETLSNNYFTPLFPWTTTNNSRPTLGVCYPEDSFVVDGVVPTFAIMVFRTGSDPTTMWEKPVTESTPEEVLEVVESFFG